MALSRRFNLLKFSVLALVLATVGIVVWSVLFWKDTIANTNFPSGVLAELLGVGLAILAAVPMSVLLVNRYQRRLKADRWKSLGETVARDSVRLIEGWVVEDLREINPAYAERVRSIIIEGFSKDLKQIAADVPRRLLRMFEQADEWLDNPIQDEVNVENLAMIRIHSRLGVRLAALREMESEIRSSGFDEPDLFIQIRALRHWWDQLGQIFRGWKVDSVLKDTTYPPPDFYEKIVEEAKAPVANVLIVFMRQAQTVRKVLLQELPPTDLRSI